MKVNNIHTRTIQATKSEVLELFKTLATNQDKVWPLEKWPRIKLDSGLKVGSKGGHGPIRYEITNYDPHGFIEFTFSKPQGFLGRHFFSICEADEDTTLLTHTIEMNTTVVASLEWIVAIRWLHDALIEDAYDKIESYFYPLSHKSSWSLWVKFLREVLK